MIKTYFTCEKCQETWEIAPGETSIQQVNIACRVNYGNGYHGFDCTYKQDILSMNWCRPCVDALNLHKPREKQKPEEVAAAPNPTTEEMLVSLLETLGFTREH